MSIKKEILKAAGVKSETDLKAFYEKYPTEESFFKAHPSFKLGGSLPEAFNMTMPMDNFFSYGVPVPPTYLQKGGENYQAVPSSTYVDVQVPKLYAKRPEPNPGEYTTIAFPDPEAFPGDSIRYFVGNQTPSGGTPYMRDLGNLAGVSEKSPKEFYNALGNPDIPEGRLYEDTLRVEANRDPRSIMYPLLGYKKKNKGGSLTNVPVFPQAQTEAQFFVPTYSNSNNAYKKGGDIVGGSYLEVHPEARNLGWSPTNYFMLQQGGMYTQDMNVPGTLPMLQQGSLQMGGNPQESENEPSFPVKKLREYMNRLKELAAIANQREQEKQLVNIQMQEMQGMQTMPMVKMPVAKYGGLQKFQTAGPYEGEEYRKRRSESGKLDTTTGEYIITDPNNPSYTTIYPSYEAYLTSEDGQKITSPASSTTGTSKTTGSASTASSTGTTAAKTTTDGSAAGTSETPTTTSAPATWKKVTYQGMPGVVDPETGQVYLTGVPGQQQQQQTGYGYPYYSPFGFRDQRGTYNLIDLFPGQKTRWRDIGFDQLTPEQLEAIRSGLANVADFDYETKRRGLLQKIGFGKPDVTRVNVKFRMPGSSPTSVPQIKDPGTAPVSTTPAVQTQDIPEGSYGPYWDRFRFGPEATPVSIPTPAPLVNGVYDWSIPTNAESSSFEEMQNVMNAVEAGAITPGSYTNAERQSQNAAANAAAVEQKRKGGPYALPFFQFGGDDPFGTPLNIESNPQYDMRWDTGNEIPTPESAGFEKPIMMDLPMQEEFNVGLDIGKEKSFDPFFAAKVQMAADVMNNMGEAARSQMSGADQNFAAMSPFRGDYVVNTPAGVDFRPDQMVTRYGGSYAQYGGAQEDFIVSGDNYYLTPQMLMKLQRFIGR